MEYEMKDNSGAIFKNHNKKETKHPDYKGTVKIGGVVKDIALWVKQTKKGDNYFSVLVSDQRQKQENPFNRNTSQTAPTDDDLPF